MRLAALAAVLGVLAVLPAAAQPKREDPLQAEQRKLQQTQKQLKEEKERAAAARARETSLLAALEEIERRLAGKQNEVARLEARIKKAQADVQLFRGEISKLERQRAGQVQALAGRLRVMYRVHAQGGKSIVLLLRGWRTAKAGKRLNSRSWRASATRRRGSRRRSIARSQSGGRSSRRCATSGLITIAWWAN